MSQVMQPRIRHDTGSFACPGPERPKVIRTQRPVSLAARKHPLPGCCFGESVQQLPHGLTEQNVPRSGLRVNQSKPVGLDLAPAQAANLAPAYNRSAGATAPPRRIPGSLPHASAGPRRASPDRPPRAAARAADGDSERCRCKGSRQLRADGPTRWRSRTWCAVCHDSDSRRPASCVRIRGRSGRCRPAPPSRRADGREWAGWRC